MKVFFAGSGAQHRPGVVAQLFHQYRLTSAKVSVKQGVEPGGVVHLGQMGEFVADYVVAQFGGKKYQGIAQGDVSPERAGAEGAESGRDGPSGRIASHPRSQFACPGE